MVIPRRSRAREVVLQLLFQDDLNPGVSDETVMSFMRRRLHDNKELLAFASGLLNGVREHRKALDAHVSRRAANWSLERMAVPDRNIIRLGAYELLYTETPGAVVINEAVEMAKRFGSKQSAQFVNGLLDRLLHDRPATSNENSPAE